VKRQRTDHRVDLYALGVTAYEIYTYQLPWERTASSEENFRRRMNTPPRVPKELNRIIDDATNAFLLKSIGRDPSERFQTALEFKLALDKLKDL
jgi:eukaryotic-like serine/threonine-protein kinase